MLNLGAKDGPEKPAEDVTSEPAASGTQSQAPRERRSVYRRVRRAVYLFFSVLALVIAAALVTTLTVDLGPRLRELAERQGSQAIERRIHIGKLGVHLASGRFVVEDLVIEGLRPTDRPFLRATRLAVSMGWRTLIEREVLIESVDMTDWEMLVETFRDGRHNFPKFTSDRPSGPKRFTTTVQWVHAYRGQFTFEDHGTPWSTVARNLDFTLARLADYRGQATFSGGAVRIRDFEPMTAAMNASFRLDGGRVQLDRIDLTTDGATTVASGEAYLTRWPEQTYDFRSRVELPRMREIFFAGQDFTLEGLGTVNGRFHLFKGGRRLTGDFSSDLMRLNRFEVPNVRGSMVWLPDRFEISNGSSRFHGGSTRFSYSMAPLGLVRPALARFDVTYSDVNLASLTDFLETRGLRVIGRASGRHLLEWPLGRFAGRRGNGELRVAAPADADLLRPGAPPPSGRTFTGHFRAPLGYVPVGGQFDYTYDPEWIHLERGHLATETSYVSFHGRTANGERSDIPFDVLSADWQESDRLLAGVLTAVGSPTRAVEIGGRGEFHGRIVGSFSRPRVEGTFAGEDLRAWDVVWGSGSGAIVMENSYLDVTDGVVRRDGSEIRAAGRFSLGYPRRDGGEEINARFSVVRRPVADLRHAFELDDYKVDGTLSGDYHLFGRYQRPQGYGDTIIENGVAYREPFQRASASLRFEGSGIRFDGIKIQKATGAVTGAAYLGLNGTYSFDADGERVPIEALNLTSYPKAPLTGLVNFSSSGRGTFDQPRYDVRFRVDDLFIRDEGIGQVIGRLSVRDQELTIELDAASPRLAASGAGRIALTPGSDADLSFRFNRTSVDPYLRAFDPRFSPFTTVLATGVLRIEGPLETPERLNLQAAVEALDVRLFDYQLANEGPIRLTLSDRVLTLEAARLVGQDTRLDLSGSYDTVDQQIRLRAEGDANLGILQGFVRDLNSSGRAAVIASVQGPVQRPVFSGRAEIYDGRIRHLVLPHSIDRLNGRISLAADGVTLDELVGTVGEGRTTFGGRIALTGFRPGELYITASGERMHLRYPEGFQSIVDADLTLGGTLDSPLLSGTVHVASATFERPFNLESGLFEFAKETPPAPPAAAEEGAVPLRFDVRILAPSTLRIEKNTARIVSSADLQLRGTYQQPLLFGRAEIERGEVTFEGRRYLVTRGAIDFSNPFTIEPFFDVEAETRVRAPGQTYLVTLRATGTTQALVAELNSDPPLPEAEILTLLFGDPRSTQDVELRALRTPNAVEQDLLRTRAARLLASPISSEVGRVVEQTFGVDTFQITPSFDDPYLQSSRLNPSARLTIGKRISDRVYLTFSRSLSSSTRDQIILLEYDESDRLSWILTQNEDRTYSLDVRIRKIF
ncbi:MAG: translocation/assembly module TamB [Acidobacteria bacterium]|nr:translocation/assembly module TamB [Acidobacteriota bacterium]